MLFPGMTTRFPYPNREHPSDLHFPEELTYHLIIDSQSKTLAFKAQSAINLCHESKVEFTDEQMTHLG